MSERCARSRCQKPAFTLPGQAISLCLAHHSSIRPKRSRYGVARKKVKVRGESRSFASQWEADRAVELLALEKAGIIRNLRFQVYFHLEINGTRIESYIADFVYEQHEVGFKAIDFKAGTVNEWPTVVEDAKNGLLTNDYKRKRKWMKAAHGITIYEHHKPRKR